MSFYANNFSNIDDHNIPIRPLSLNIWFSSNQGMHMNQKLEQLFTQKVRDKVILITGASSGIGLTTAKKLAAAGAHVLLVARTEETLKEVFFH